MQSIQFKHIIVLASTFMISACNSTASNTSGGTDKLDALFASQIQEQQDAQRIFKQKTVYNFVSDQNKAAAMSYFNATLKDPYSANISYGFEALNSNTGITSVCGYVNAKNSYGAYIGTQRFYVDVAANGRVISGGINAGNRMVESCGLLGAT